MITATKAIGCLGLLLATALGTAACSGTDATVNAATSGPAAPRAGATLFSDSFQDDHNGWALPENAQGRTVMQNGDFVWESKQPNLRPHLLAQPLADASDRGELRMRDVVVSSDVTPVRGKAAFGVFCRETRDADADFQWYEFVARNGYAAIRVGDSAGHLDVLAKTTSLDLPLGKRAAIEAACVDDAKGRVRLWLSVNDRALLFARIGHPLGNGAAGLQAYDAPANASKDRLLLRWHDFTISRAVG